MHAAVYKGDGAVEVEEVPVPTIGPGEMLVRVEACGICHTDLKKIEHDLLRAAAHFRPRDGGRGGRKRASGSRKFQPGDRVVAFHHIPCMNCFYCGKQAVCAVRGRTSEWGSRPDSSRPAADSRSTCG